MSRLSERVHERFRKRLSRAVERARAKFGTMDLAVKHVGGKIGMSGMAVYRVLGRYGGVKIQAHHHVALLVHAMAPSQVSPFRGLFNAEHRKVRELVPGQ